MCVVNRYNNSILPVVLHVPILCKAAFSIVAFCRVLLLSRIVYDYLLSLILP